MHAILFTMDSCVFLHGQETKEQYSRSSTIKLSPNTNYISIIDPLLMDRASGKNCSQSPSIKVIGLSPTIHTRNENWDMISTKWVVSLTCT